jgi:hypothetical protein
LFAFEDVGNEIGGRVDMKSLLLREKTVVVLVIVEVKMAEFGQQEWPCLHEHCRSPATHREKVLPLE